MRYRKGHVAISDTRDVPVLLAVRNARATTMSQLIEELRYAGLETNHRSTYWRLNRLVASGYLEQIEHAISVADPVYAITNSGLALLESRGHILLTLSSTTKTIISQKEVLHMLEINSIRLALKKAGILEEWKTELEVISENLVNYGNTGKDYDAIVTVNNNGRRTRFALEYERTAKSGSRYSEISQSILCDVTIDLVLYLAPSHEMLSLLAQEFRSLGDKAVFGFSKQFKFQLLQTPVLTVGDRPEFRKFTEILDHLPEMNDSLLTTYSVPFRP
jgi:DNA-binding PadR family transcriptional regulator